MVWSAIAQELKKALLFSTPWNNYFSFSLDNNLSPHGTKSIKKNPFLIIIYIGYGYSCPNSITYIYRTPEIQMLGGIYTPWPRQLSAKKGRKKTC